MQRERIPHPAVGGTPGRFKFNILLYSYLTGASKNKPVRSDHNDLMAGLTLRASIMIPRAHAIFEYQVSAQYIAGVPDGLCSPHFICYH